MYLATVDEKSWEKGCRAQGWRVFGGDGRLFHYNASPPPFPGSTQTQRGADTEPLAAPLPSVAFFEDAGFPHELGAPRLHIVGLCGCLHKVQQGYIFVNQTLHSCLR